MQREIGASYPVWFDRHSGCGEDCGGYCGETVGMIVGSALAVGSGVRGSLPTNHGNRILNLEGSRASRT